MARKKKDTDSEKEYIPKEEASKIVNGGDPPYKLDDTTTTMDKATKEAQLLTNVADAVKLRRVEVEGRIKLERNRQRMELEKIKALETGREKGKKHISSYGLFYISLLAGGFIFAASILQPEVLSVVSAVISIMVVNVTAILANVIKEDEPEDPTQLMHNIVQKQLSIQHEKEIK